ncbi:hypothetical protein SPI_02847 [Niveomyces insectorum RCEF 264]|uniref:Uncharacterized protein n=1 Tax=Niveomyces insectorum RCEF 264 TaxID=1081102 RepID=A0A162MMM6_9HYPO|nr:hypothetical protein SPI_02847 [Niveomyces insectorum RCEF 264]
MQNPSGGAPRITKVRTAKPVLSGSATPVVTELLVRRFRVRAGEAGGGHEEAPKRTDEE